MPVVYLIYGFAGVAGMSLIFGTPVMPALTGLRDLLEPPKLRYLWSICCKRYFLQ
jgi:hypothetical protein